MAKMMILYCHITRLAIVTALALVLTTSCLHAAMPVVTMYPTVSSNPIVADGTTQYTVSLTASDVEGYDHISCLRVLFNFTEAGGDTSKGRGYMAWGTTDAIITTYGGTWILADASEARWGYRADAWGGTTYVQPLSCSVENSGNASGGIGYRTIMWTFTAKPAWAANPLVNDCDVWAEDSAGNKTYWVDSPGEFDVVGSACASYAAVPRPPEVSNATTTTAQVSIHPEDSDADLYCIRIAPADENKNYVQSDGTLSPIPRWHSKSEWSITNVVGLAKGTTYSFAARAWNPTPGVCPSVFGGAAQISTAAEDHAINALATGKTIERGLIGQATRLGVQGAIVGKTWDVLYDTCVRGVAGGLDADTYNWKDMSGREVGHTGLPGPAVPTTLDWMRLVRDHRSLPLVTANIRGIGPPESSGVQTFYYSDKSIGTLTQLAADWVRYVNFILPTYRQGDTLPPSDQAILDSINWYGRPKLLEPGEAPTPKVTYWEIGNEPAVSIPGVYSMGIADFHTRYKAVSAAILAVDPEIRVGPSHCTAGEFDWLDEVLKDYSCVIDFIAFHPFGTLYRYASQYGDTTASAESALRATKADLKVRHDRFIERILATGRNPADIRMITSEYNPSDWIWEVSPQVRRVSHALGLFETLFTFAELDVFAANFWSCPAWAPDGTETPGYKVFEMLQQHWGQRLIDSYSDNLNFRMYTTWNQTTQEVTVWAINCSENIDKHIRVSLPGMGEVSSVTQKRLQNLAGTTSLFDTNDPPATAPSVVDWVTTDLTGTVSPSGFVITFPKATATVLVFVRKAREVDKCGQARTLYDGAPITLDGKVVSRVFTDCAYIQEPDRSSGIQVMGQFDLEPGDVVDLQGVVGIQGSEVVIRSAILLNVTNGEPPKPLLMNNLSTGGGALHLQPATVDYAHGEPFKRKWSSGISPIGLLVKTSGKVTYVDPTESFAYLDDGSTLEDGSGYRGVRFSLEHSPIPVLGADATLTACISLMEVGGNCARFLRPGCAADTDYAGMASWLKNGGFERANYAPWVSSGPNMGIRSGTWYTVVPHTGNFFIGVYGPKVCYSGTVHQTVSVPPCEYRASVWSVVFHPSTTDPEIAKNRVGIDPTGGTDPSAVSVAWSPWHTTTGTTVTPWHELTTPLVSVAGGNCTVFLEYVQQDPTRFHLNCFDDAVLQPY